MTDQGDGTDVPGNSAVQTGQHLARSTFNEPGDAFADQQLYRLRPAHRCPHLPGKEIPDFDFILSCRRVLRRPTIRIGTRDFNECLRDFFLIPQSDFLTLSVVSFSTSAQIITHVAGCCFVVIIGSCALLVK